MTGLCRGELPMGLLRSFALQSYRQRSSASKPWNKCNHFYKNERITTIHSVFCSFLLSIFSGRAQQLKGIRVAQAPCPAIRLKKCFKLWILIQNRMLTRNTPTLGGMTEMIEHGNKFHSHCLSLVN